MRSFVCRSNVWSGRHCRGEALRSPCLFPPRTQVADAWLDVWQGLVAQHAATGQGPAACDTRVGCAPHPAVLASAAAAQPGRAEQAAALAWRVAQARAEVCAAELDDAALLNPRSLHRCAVVGGVLGAAGWGMSGAVGHLRVASLSHMAFRRLTFLVAYSTLWLRH